MLPAFSAAQAPDFGKRSCFPSPLVQRDSQHRPLSVRDVKDCLPDAFERDSYEHKRYPSVEMRWFRASASYP